MKKIIITIKDNGKGKESCNINLKMDKNEKATENENLTASMVYHAVSEKLEELKNIK